MSGRQGLAPADGPGSDRRSFRGLRIAAVALALPTVGLAIGAALYSLARHVAAGNSDGATVVLEGQAVGAGHLLLAGWSLSLDSFWSIDVPFYSLAVHFGGLRGPLMALVPAVIACVVVLVGALIASDGRRSLAGATGALAAALVLTFPSRAMALFFLQGPLHIGTLLWCLIAFLALQREGFGLRFAIGVIFLAAGLLGDLQTLLLGLAPLLIAALVLGHLQKSLRGVRSLLVAPFAAALLALAVHEIAKLLGTFVVPRTNPYASPAQFLRNVAHLPGFFAALLGVRGGPFPPTELPLVLELAHLLGLALVLLGPAVVACQLLGALRRRGERASTLAPSTRMDTILLAAFAMGIVTFLVLPITDSNGYARYLLPAVITGAVLGGRVLARLLARGDQRQVITVLAGVALLGGSLGASFALETRGGPARAPSQGLAAVLEAHRLHQGVGDYWSSSVVTVESKGAVTVRPVIASPSGQLVRYAKQSSSRWYGPRQRFNFFVFNAGAVWNRTNGPPAIATLGEPLVVYPYGSYRIYVWAKPFTLSTRGSTGP